MWHRFTKKVKKAIVDNITLRGAIIIGSLIGSILTLLVSSLVFTYTYSGRLEAVEAANKELPNIKNEIQQLQINDSDKTKSISDIRDSQLRAEQRTDQIYNLLISKNGN